MRGEARNPPTVSVLLAVYNGQDHVRQAIEGILTQSLQDFEFIIVDDGSTDRTSQILDEYADPRIVRLRHPENRGLIAALNTGLAAARGEFVARQDADDFSYPDRFRAQVDFLRARPDIALVGSSWDFEPEGGERRTRTANRILSASHGCFCSTVLSRTARSCSAARSSRISEAMGWATISSKISRSGRVS